MKRVLILDGDPFAWKAAVKEEKSIVWDDGIVTAYTDVEKAIDNACRQINKLAQEQSAEVVFCWSDPKGYFREGLGDYKEQRKQAVRPLALTEIKEGLAARYESYMKPTLEGDDVIGILMTEPRFKKGYEKICVSIDKDLKTVPGLNLNPDKDTEPKLITEHEADLFFYAQVIAGDPTDGFKGAPSFGMDTAMKMLKDKQKVELYQHELQRGKRKGETELRRRFVNCDDYWKIVLSAYEVNGLSEEVALMNARMARILRASDWNNEEKEVILWEPKKI